MSEIISLNQQTRYDIHLQYYEANKHRPWQEWLKLKKIFNRRGKQGVTGIFTAIADENLTYIFKMSQYINYLCQHELAISTGLNKLGDYCPNFCKGFGYIFCEAPSDRDKNPFEKETTNTIEKEVLLLEYIKNSKQFYHYIHSKKVEENALYSIIKQTLLAIAIAQRKQNFTHYDLHSNNIMIKKCSKDLVFQYVLDKDNIFCVPSYGYYPVIIDYGFSYCREMEYGSLWPSLCHTDIGFSSHVYNPYVDAKLFLVTVSDEIDVARQSRKSKKLKNITKNIYRNLEIDWDSGWDKDSSSPLIDFVYDEINKICKYSKVFNEYPYYALDIIQSLVQLPLQSQSERDIKLPFTTFIKEFIKIEKQVGSIFYCLYILKNIVDVARTVRNDYNNPETRNSAVDYFKFAVLQRVDSVAKFCVLKDLHYEKLLCSLLCLAKPIENILYNSTRDYNERKDRDYKNVKYKLPEDLATLLEINLPESYVFNSNTVVYTIDCLSEQCYRTVLESDDMKYINTLSYISRGKELHKIINFSTTNKCLAEEMISPNSKIHGPKEAT